MLLCDLGAANSGAGGGIMNTRNWLGLTLGSLVLYIVNYIAQLSILLLVKSNLSANSIHFTLNTRVSPSIEMTARTDRDVDDHDEGAAD